MKIYSMECFIVYRLNEASRNKDENMVDKYGPFAAVLSHIIGSSSYVENTTLYRGLSLSKAQFEEDFKAKKTQQFNGFKSFSVKKEEAL